MKSTGMSFQDGQVFRVPGPTVISTKRFNAFHLYGTFGLITLGIVLGFLVSQFFGKISNATAFYSDANHTKVKTTSEASVTPTTVTSTDPPCFVTDSHQINGHLTEEIKEASCIPAAEFRMPNKYADSINGSCYYMLLTDVDQRHFVINYRDNLRCTYLFYTRHTCRIHYSFFVDTESCCDYLNVTNGYSTTKFSGTYGLLSGATREEFLKIFFHTDYSGTMSNMNVSFNAIRMH